MRHLLLLSALAFGVAHASVPARLIGIWELERPGDPDETGDPTARLSIGGGTVWGSFGCGKFAGTIDAAEGRVAIRADVLPPSPNERCPYAGNLPFARDLGAATRYVVSRDHLVLFSGTARLAFRRAGFITPAKP